jgi:hypothetical protein
LDCSHESLHKSKNSQIFDRRESIVCLHRVITQTQTRVHGHAHNTRENPDGRGYIYLNYAHVGPSTTQLNQLGGRAGLAATAKSTVNGNTSAIETTTIFDRRESIVCHTKEVNAG